MKSSHTSSFPTALFGFGNISHGYLSDPLLTKYYKYVTHAQVLFNHPSFDWRVVVDPSDDARLLASNDWHVPHIFSSHLDSPNVMSDIEIAVLATPPHVRLPLLKSMPNLRAVLVEKPLGLTHQDSVEFINYCHEHNILVQVNYWRRSDTFFMELAGGLLDSLVGKIQSVHVIYGNGLLNNGSHMIDFTRMLFGNLVFSSDSFLHHSPRRHEYFPLKNDLDICFSLFATGLCIPIHFDTVDFSSYRENGISIWGSLGKLEILNEGLTIQHCPKSPSRSTLSCFEISHDNPANLDSTVGTALYEMYSNLISSLLNITPLHSSGESALETSQIVNTIFDTAQSYA